jgi:tetratricopeptide (TPR) repeat protein
MKPTGTKRSGDKMLSRRDYLQILDAATQAESFRFARQAALAWLATFPGDLWVNCYLGKAQLGEGRAAQATAIFEKLCALDPEFLEARQGLVQCYRAQANKLLENAQACVYALGGDLEPGAAIPEWGKQLRLARQAMMQGSQELADRAIQQVIAMTPDLPLVAVTHIRLTALEGQPEACHQLANVYHTRWPDCLQFGLYLAEGEVAFGDEAKAVSLLHQCVSGDSAGQVASRLWGSDHRYRPLWPESLEVYFDLPIPAPVAAQLGRNQLAAGEIIVPPLNGEPVSGRPQAAATVANSLGSTDPKIDKSSDSRYVSHVSPETIHSVEETFDRLAKRMKKPSLGRADGRYPLYVILSTRQGLEQQYGPQTRGVIEDLMKNIGDLIAHRPEWGSLVFLPDDAASMSKLGLKPVDTLDPWKIKLALTDLDQALTKKGQMIGSILIVGGPEVVPYHKLPNPTDDADKDVPSDNPYMTLDSNYFVPEWPLGRLAGGSGSDAGLLLEQLRGIIRYHGKSAKTMPTLATIITWLLEFLRSRSIRRKEPGFGYTAEVWKLSSKEVFKVLSESGNLISSPPEQSSSVSGEQIVATPLGYFNLHGIEDGPDWYGQRDSANNLPGPDYPVALSPRNLTKNGHAPQVIYSEACYGANIIDKKEDESLALKFMMIGTSGFIGSTVISYGSVGAPLIGADLLGSLFWRHMKEGLTAGESLMQAKIELVKEMTQRQGFLDGEDQKTLISFVLYGDPLVGYDSNQAQSKAIVRTKNRAEVKTICDRQVSDQGMQPVSARVLNQVKAAVSGYLPGVEEPEVVVSFQHTSCDGTRHSCPTSEIGDRTVTTAKSNGVVVTVSKKIMEAQYVHRKYARVTLNSRGKVVKLVVSR